MARQDEIADASIFTTDAVLSEFLTFFAGDKRLRNRAGRTVEALLEDPDIGCSGATGQKVALRTVLCNLFHRPAL
jgi:hypothetical protein